MGGCKASCYSAVTFQSGQDIPGRETPPTRRTETLPTAAGVYCQNGSHARVARSARPPARRHFKRVLLCVRMRNCYKICARLIIRS